jgi:hypothetical protein
VKVSAGRAQGAQKGLLRDTVAASMAVAVLAIVLSGIAGHLAVGIGLGAGLVIGSLNGHLVAALMARDTPFVMGSVVRMAILSAVAVLTAVLLGSPAWAVLLGVGGAQLVMVGAGVRQGIRA